MAASKRLAKTASNKKTPKKQNTRPMPTAKKTLESAKEKNLLPSLSQNNPEAAALARNVALRLLEKKATDIVLFDVCQKSSYADAIVLASGESTRHLSSLSKHIWESLKKDEVRPMGVEGGMDSSWVLMDFGDVVVHLFLPEIRALYDLDGLWSDVAREYFR
jgi:ribosome-associated protein